MLRFACNSLFVALAALLTGGLLPAQQVTLQGLRSLNHAGAFHGLRQDSAGSLYTLFDAADGVRLQKYSADGTRLLAETHVGQNGDSALALELDAAGNIYVTGTSNSLGSLTGTSGTSFPNRAGTRTNSFLARFSPALQQQWLTFCGAEPMAAAGVAVSGSTVYVTGSIFAATLPVTSGGIQQNPATGSNGNGFVESFSTASGTLQYATYLTGANGDTAPTAIAADASGNTYIAGTTSATGFPTTAALVPVFRSVNGGTSSGFLTRLTAAGDGFTFSTFVPGRGLTSVALDANGTGSILLSGDIATGLFPVLRAQTPVASQLAYQTAARLTLDGSAVSSSTLLAPATQSLVTPTGAGTAWVAASTQNTAVVPLLPVATLQRFGNAFAVRLDASGLPDRGARFGGLPVTNSSYASLPATEGGITVASSGVAVIAASIAPTLSSDLLSSETYDFSLVAAPSAALPSAIRDALPTPDCNGSACSGSAGLLAQLAPSGNAPSLALSSDDLPNLIVRNLGTATANNLQISATGYQVSSGCGASLLPGDACPLLLSGSGPGSITVRASNAGASIAQLPATSNSGRPIAVLPRELDFGIVTATSAAATRTLTVTNLGGSTQVFASGGISSTGTPYSLTESATTCTPSGTGTSKVLAPGGSCTITLALQASSSSSTEGAVNTVWTVGSNDTLITGYTQPSSLSVSASTLDFGRQFVGGLRSGRYLFLSNSSDQAVAHTTVASTNSAFAVTDACPASLQPSSVCRIGVTYQAATAPSSDALSLNVDGLQVSVVGETFPQPSVTGASTNPNLTVSPGSVTFNNAVPVTEASSETYSISVTNTGKTSFPLTLSTSGDFTFTTGCPTMLNGGSSCSAVVTFTPTAQGTRQGLLAVATGTGAPTYVALSGIGSGILSSGSGSLSFADTPLNAPTVQWVKVTQSFPSLTVASSDPNFSVLLVEDIGFGYGAPSAGAFSSSYTGSCYNCYLGVQFRPEAVGAQAGTITLTSRGSGRPSSLAAIGNGVPLVGLILTPVSEDFGAAPIHSASGIVLATLTNGTSGNISLSGVSVSGDFAMTSDTTGAAACTTGSLAPGAACIVPLRFTPTAAGSRTGQVQVSTSAGQATASLTGMGTDDPGIALSPVALTFDNVPGTASTQQTVTITNTGSNAVTMGTPQVSTGQFVATSACGALAPGALCTALVTYTPGSNPVSGSLYIPVTSAPTGSPRTQQFMVSLQGLYSAESTGLQLVPGEHTSINYGSAATGTPALQRVLHLNNLSQHTVTVQVQTPRQFALTGSTCSTLAAGAGCDLTVQATPLTAGPAMGTLIVAGVPVDGSATQSVLGYLESYATGAASKLSITGNLTPTGVLDFGQVSSGQSVTQVLTITNPVGAAAALTVRRTLSEQPFASTTTCGLPLAPGQSCTVTLTYSPIYQVPTGSGQTSTQANQGSLVLESDGSDAPQIVYLTGTATPTYVASPSNTIAIAAFDLSQGSLNFTSTAVGTASAAQTLTLTNSGTAVLHVQTPVLSNGFTASSTCGTLAPGDTCTMSVQYVPQSTAAALGALEIQSDSSDSLEFVSLLGTVQPGQTPTGTQSLVLAPQPVDFGRVLARTSSSQLLNVTNSGSLPVTLGTRSIAGDSSFALAASSSGTPCGAAGSVLQPGQTCTVALTFTPASTGTLYGTLSLASSATAQPLTVPLSGVGIQPQLAVSPGALSFGDVAVGSTATRALTLLNSGASAVDGLSFSASAGFAVSTTCGITTLNAGSSCAVNVTFAPGVAGVATGVLTIKSTDPASPISVPLSGNGLQTTGVAITSLSAAPSSLNFNTVPVGSTSTLSLVLSNPTGTTASGLLFTASAGFTTTNSCGTTLNAYSTCAVLVTFQPGSTSTVTGSLTVQSSGSTTPLVVALTGSGTAIVPQLSATPAFLAFGSVPVGNSTTLAVTLTNSSSSPVNQLSYALPGAFSAAGTCGTTLAGNASCNLLVTFSPTTAGAVAGTLVVGSTDAASPLTIALTGSGAVLPPRLTLTPSTLDFGSQSVGSSTTLVAALKNNSGSSVSALTFTTTQGFAVTTTCGTVLAPGSSCSVSLTFTPTLAGSASGLLTVSSSDPASPLTASLTGTATVPSGSTGGFTLSVNGGTSGSATVQSGLPASYALMVTPTGGYTGTVALTCTADTQVEFAACSLVPSSVTLSGTAQNATATISTVSAVTLSKLEESLHGHNLLWCLTPAVLLLIPRRRVPIALLMALFCALLSTTGCGSGGDPRIRYVAPGTYTFHVTATSTSGQTVAQTATLTLTVTPR